MNDDRDPLLEALFTEPQADLPDDDFTAAVMTRIQKRRRRVIGGRIAIALALIAFEVLLASPLQTAVGAMTEALSTSLVQIENDWAAVAVAPLNSVAGVVGMVLIGMQFLYRWLVR